MSFLISGRTLADRAFEWLEEAIIKGDYAPETRIDEVALAKLLGISRGPVREAIRRLEGKKLVERIPHIGARVVAPTKSGLFDLLLIREPLEGLACRLATERMTDTEIAELAKLLEIHAAQPPLKAGHHYFQSPGDYDFHFRIIQGSGNEKLIQYLADDIYHLLRISRYRSSSRGGRAQESLEEHRWIVEAMLARDAEAAEARMRIHVTHARQSIVDELAESEKQKTSTG